jgi:hypothetical protein
LGGEIVLEDEYGHKGIDKETLIDRLMIESNEYRRKFDNCTENKEVNKTLYDCAKEILTARSGTRYESMRWIEGNTGKVVAAFDSMGVLPRLSGKAHELKVEYGRNILHKIKKYENIIVIHNHPNSTAPSVGDFNSAFEHGYAIGFVVTHDGRVFRYTAHDKIIETAFDMNWHDFYNEVHDEVTAQMMAIQKLMMAADITCKEIFR